MSATQDSTVLHPIGLEPVVELPGPLDGAPTADIVHWSDVVQPSPPSAISEFFGDVGAESDPLPLGVRRRHDELVERVLQVEGPPPRG